MTRPLLLTDARLANGELVDVLVADGTVVSVAASDARSASDAARDAGIASPAVVALDGRVLLPGLWDRHVHFSQWAMTSRRIDLSGVESAAEAARLVATAIDDGADDVIGFGYRDGLWPDAPTRALLDGVSGERSVVLVAGDLHACWLNTAAARRFGVLEIAGVSGVLREDDCFRVVRELDDVADEVLDGWVADAEARAAARGIVGVVDYEMRWNLADWQRRHGSREGLLRVEFGIYTRDLDRAVAMGLRTGQVVDGTDGLVRVGGYKVITDGSLNTRTAWCFDPYPGLDADGDPYGLCTVPIDELTARMQQARDAGIAPAVHAIGDRANAAALDALETVAPSGWGGRASIEHAQLLCGEDIARFARLGIVASVQPEHAMDDRDVADRYWAGRTDRAFPLAELADAGVELALGSDAPVAPLDPWIAISAGVVRRRAGREPWHPEQALDVRAALAASTRGRGVDVVTGMPADLIAVDRDPLNTPGEELRGMPVALTLVGGRETHRAL